MTADRENSRISFSRLQHADRIRSVGRSGTGDQRKRNDLNSKQELGQMSRATRLTAWNLRVTAFVLRWATAISLLLLPALLSAQTSQSGSLADIARQLRAQKQGQAGATTNAQQVADELSDDQNRVDDAPGGFKTYNAGDYSLWVPAPYKVSGRDDAGVVLEGPVAGSKRPLLLIGSPLLLPPGASDNAFREAAAKFSHAYARTASCAKTAAGSRSAYKCSLTANLSGTRVSGNVWLLRNANAVYPVLCAAPSAGNDRDSANSLHDSNKEAAREGLDRDDPDMKSVWQKCDTVFQSIRPKEIKAQPARAQSGSPAGLAPVAVAQPVAEKSSAGSGETGVAPQADVSRQPKQQSVSAAPPQPGNAPPASNLPAGYKVHAFHYCGGPQQCWDASVLVPVSAQLVSSDCKQYVFENKVQGTTFFLLVGPRAGECEDQRSGAPDMLRWGQLVDPESKRAPGTYNIISSQVAKLGGKAATITTLHFRNGLTDWMGRRAEVDSNGVPLAVGCMAPREHFDDGEAICSILIESLQLP
jgi:hypothetical protein